MNEFCRAESLILSRLFLLNFSYKMEELQVRHRKEQRDLVSRITQKKKQASKKTRKGVNDECDMLEQELKTKQGSELASLNGNKFIETVTECTALDVSQDLASLSSLADPHAQLHLVTRVDERSLPAADVVPLTKVSPHHGKPNRQKERLGRRASEHEAAAAQAAEEALSLPNLKEEERVKMVTEFRRRGLTEREVPANGHCMYLAVADQMAQLGLGLNPQIDVSSTQRSEEAQAGLPQDDYKTVRHAAAAYMSKNVDSFVPFLEEPLEKYLHKVKDTGEWGGQLELLALAQAYKININVLQCDGRVEKIEGCPGDKDREAWLAYYRHGFGLGEHYNSLRKEACEKAKASF